MNPAFIGTPRVYTLDDLMRLPPVSRIQFPECGGTTDFERDRARLSTVGRAMTANPMCRAPHPWHERRAALYHRLPMRIVVAASGCPGFEVPCP